MSDPSASTDDPTGDVDPAERHRHHVHRRCAEFFAGLAANGVTDVVVSPGSRSTPLAVAAHRSPLTTWVHLDERSAAFFALGLARGWRRPVALVCTSGTAAANYLPAVVEANHSGVPLLVCTADRPPELRGWGAGQTIDQVRLYGTNVRWFAELAVAAEATNDRGGRWAARAVAEATGPRPGPVHLNWPFREPLEPPASPLAVPPAPSPRTPMARPGRPIPDQAMVDDLATLAGRVERGVVAAGPADLTPESAAAVRRFAATVGWPILAEPLSQLRRRGSDDPTAPVVATADSILRHLEVGRRLAPDLVLRIGQSPTTKPLRLWVERQRPRHLVLVGTGADWAEPTGELTLAVDTDPGALLADVIVRLDATGFGRRTSAWVEAWQATDGVAATTIDEALTTSEAADPRATGPAVVRALAAALPDDTVLYVANSMPVRDVDTYWPATSGRIRLLGNRGASGIDGLVSCALGVAATGARTVLLTGDLAFLHDLGGLLAARRFGLAPVIVVVDNAGGGIFSYLPIASTPDVAFEELFLTPHGHDIGALARATGATVHPVADAADLGDTVAGACELARTTGRVQVVHVGIDHDHDLAVHRAVQARVAAALDAGLPA